MASATLHVGHIVISVPSAYGGCSCVFAMNTHRTSLATTPVRHPNDVSYVALRSVVVSRTEALQPARDLARLGLSLAQVFTHMTTMSY